MSESTAENNEAPSGTPPAPPEESAGEEVETAIEQSAATEESPADQPPPDSGETPPGNQASEESGKAQEEEAEVAGTAEAEQQEPPTVDPESEESPAGEGEPQPSEQTGETTEGASSEETAPVPSTESEQPTSDQPTGEEDTNQSPANEATSSDQPGVVEETEMAAKDETVTPQPALSETAVAEGDTTSVITPTLAEDEGPEGDTGITEQPATVEEQEAVVPSSVGQPHPVVLEDIREEEEEEEGEEVDREELLEQCRTALAEQERLHSHNTQLQHKIAEYLARKKTEDRPDPGRNVTDQEKRYIQCMTAVETLQQELQSMQEGFDQQETELKVLRDHKLAEVQQANAAFAEYKKQHVMTAVHSRSGKRLGAQEVDGYHSSEDRKEMEVTQVRLENIKLQNKIAKQESLIKQKEQLAEGLHMIDFEQLKINNVDLNEKIEERNEDILKLRKKVTSTVEVLTHVKEKLQFLQAENLEKKAQLRSLEEVVAKKRDHLTRLKQSRDALRMDNIRLRQKGGLVSHSGLLRDFEERRDQNEELKERLESLQQKHSELSVQCEGFRNRIEQARLLHPHMV